MTDTQNKHHRFHDGQEIEVFISPASLSLEIAFGKGSQWHRATVIERIEISFYRVQFPDGIRAVCDVDIMRAIDTPQ